MRNRILKALYETKGEFISGEDLSSALNVSRTAIWKHINTLKKEGYNIESINKKGYRLVETFNSLLPGEIKPHLTTHAIGKNIIYVETIDSTNNYCKLNGGELPHGTVVISEEQLKGRGRMGKEWSSPRGEGIWMSILLKPHIPPNEGTKVTQIGAAAVCKVIRDLANIDALIKWPNDIVVNGKKLCGILTEMSAEINEIHYLVVGIGINGNTKSFTEELSEIATSLALETGNEIDRKIVVASILNEFEKLYDSFIKEKSIMETISVCKKYSAILQKEVYIVRGNSKEEGLVEDINEDGNLLITMENGKKEVIYSGEVSIRGKTGYIK